MLTTKEKAGSDTIIKTKTNKAQALHDVKMAIYAASNVCGL